MKRQTLFPTHALFIFIGILVFAAIGIIPLVHSQQPPKQEVSIIINTEFANPQPVTIQGYSGSTEEPYITPDGQYLIFDDRNDPTEDTKIYYAKKVTDATFTFMGEVKGVNTSSFEGLVSMDDANNFYFARSYSQNFQTMPGTTTIYRGVFNNGTVTDVVPVEGLSHKQTGLLNMDPNISYDGNTLYFTDIDFRNGLHVVVKVAVRNPDGTFTKLADSDPRMLEFKNEFKNVYNGNVINKPLIGPVMLSRDGLEGFFNAADLSVEWNRIYTVKRNSVSDPFGVPQLIGAADGFVEGAFISGDGNHLYYHKLLAIPPKGAFKIYMVTRQK